jgi:hypothetical protein
MDESLGLPATRPSKDNSGTATSATCAPACWTALIIKRIFSFTALDGWRRKKSLPPISMITRAGRCALSKA